MIHTKEKAKEIGQFFTPEPIVRFMADLFTVPRVSPPRALRVLDPGAGMGCLGFALATRLINAGHRVELVFVEQDPETLDILAERILEFEAKHSPTVQISIQATSFLEPEIRELPQFDYAILNPPYFKLKASDVVSTSATARMYKGSPNIYASFMAISLSLLIEGGQMVSITPRSFANGAYFKGFREYLYETGSLEYCHIFESRKEAFGSQSVLQENVVTLYCRGQQGPAIAISSSNVEELNSLGTPLDLPVELAIPEASATIRMPGSAEDFTVLERVNRWRQSLESLGLRISTGPIVEHRSKELILPASAEEGIPLVRMHNVRCCRVSWEGSHRKDARFINRMGKSRKLLVPNRRGTLLLKRFTSKEEARRLVVGLPEESLLESCEWMALENHLNYIAGAPIDQPEFSLGLCVLLNSRLLDDYFRIISGNTQVNATDLRATPLPEREMLLAIGEAAALVSELTPEVCSEIVDTVLG